MDGSPLGGAPFLDVIRFRHSLADQTVPIGSQACRTTMSPLSQCLPTTRDSIGGAAEAREASAHR